MSKNRKNKIEKSLANRLTLLFEKHKQYNAEYFN